MAAAIVADDVVKLILPLKSEEFRWYNEANYLQKS
jgi:hypothetical protein